MLMPSNCFKRAIVSGKPQIGLWVSLCSSFAAEVVEGIRGVSGLQRGNRFGRVSDYIQQVEQQTCVILQLETRQALSQAHEIALLDGVDATRLVSQARGTESH